MNKYEFKSAYDKITLSDDFKREAKEKLRAMAGGDRSALPLYGDCGERAVEIKASERVKSPAKAIIGIVSAAAVLAACVLGGRYLLKRNPGIIDPNVAAERQWTDCNAAYELCHGNSEKPCSEEFANELSEGAKAFHERNLEDAREHGYSEEIEKNPEDFRVIAHLSYAFPSGADYFLVKEYSFVQALDAGYFEIYFLKGGEAELLGEFNISYTTLISDGEYLYYIYDGILSRISQDGNVEDIVEFKENDPEYPNEAMAFDSSYIGLATRNTHASGSGDILTIYNICYTDSEGENYTYNYTINVSTLEATGHRVIPKGYMPKPFADTDTDEYDLFCQPFERYFAEIPGSLMFTDSIKPYEEYLNGFDVINNPSDNIMGYPNLYSFVRCFKLTPDQILVFLAYLVEDEEYGITDDMIKNLIIEDNASEASAFFANKYALVIGNKIYSPNWLYLHTVEEWEEAGVICRSLEDVAVSCRDFPFTDDARAAFEAKFEKALGYHVSLEYQPLVYETAEPVTGDVPDEPAELTYDDLATIDEYGNYKLSGHTGSAYIDLQPITAFPAPERDESTYKTFGDPVSAATEAIDRSKFHGLTIVGQVDINGEGAEYVYPLEDTYGVDMGKTAAFDPRVLPDYTLDAATSVYNDDIVSLHYTGGNGGEFYVNITAKEYEGKLERYVTDDNNNIYMPKATDGIQSYVMSEKDFDDHNFINSYGAFSFMYIGGKQVDGENYFYAYRKSGDMPEDFTLCLSAKGCSLDDFMDIVAAVVQFRAWGFGDFNGFRLTDGALPGFDPTSYELQYSRLLVDTEHGTLVLNQGKYLGTGAGYNYEVNSAVPKNEMGTLYTEADMTEFTGNSTLFELPLGFEPTETSVDYMANYADFHDGYNIQLFHEGRPLLGESETDEDFIEAHKYFYDGYCYAYDKLPYFEDKTPMVQVYDADFTDGNSTVSVQAYKGDFGQRYMGFGFRFLPAEPSSLCEDYYNDYVYEQGNGENSLTRIFAAEYSDHMDETLRNHYYGGFFKNGVYYVVTVENVDEQTFADILAALYQG